LQRSEEMDGKRKAATRKRCSSVKVNMGKKVEIWGRRSYEMKQREELEVRQMQLETERKGLRKKRRGRESKQVVRDGMFLPEKEAVLVH